MQALRTISVFVLLLNIPYALADSGSSAKVRKDKFVQAGVHGGVNGSGSNFGLFLPGDNRIDVSYSMSSIEFLGLTYKENLYSLEFQSFLGNSFYYALGVTQRNLEITIRDFYIPETGGVTTYLTSKGQSIGPHLVIGNEWQWDYFYLGAEWVGVISSSSWKYENEYPDGTWTQSETDYWDKNIEKAIKQSSFMGLNLTLGFSF
ncbi:hypothetical protein [Oligoflexus tunisiensis]|uniref:hypothetical protein n=1 Tax=Oligoflexus tunisiensis TaxID=708132 RepID=UPI00114CE88F|nr:hypothetical protein [Oligoflexus tunisiensis]